MPGRTELPWRGALVLAGGLLFSLVALWHVGRLGFQFEDLSIPFDGGYRIWLGQHPFVDFMAPTGPVLYFQQALFFAIFGVGFNAYLLHAAVLNGLAGLLVWRLTTSRGVLLAGVATVTTWCWFYLPPGAPYIDTSAFFWTLVGLWALAEGRGHLAASPTADRPFFVQAALLMASGTAASLAFLTKQNIGGLALGGLALLLYLDLRDRPQGAAAARVALAFTTGLALPWLVWVTYLGSVGGWDAFVHYFWHVPADSGRLKMLVPWGARMVIKVLRPDAVNSTFAYMLGPALREVIVYATSAWLAWRWWRAGRSGPRFWWAVGVFLLLQQQWSYNTSNNNESLYWPYCGLLGVVLYLAWRNGFEGDPRLRPPRPWPVLLGGLLLASLGYALSAERRVHDLRPHALGPALEHPRLGGLRLYPEEGEHFSDLVAFLQREVGETDSFFVLGDPGLLYGITGRTPPRGLLWYRRGVSFSTTDNATSDRLIRRSLMEPPLRWVVLDSVGYGTLIDQFPRFEQRLAEDFTPASAIGPYRLYRRRGPGEGALSPDS